MNADSFLLYAAQSKILPGIPSWCRGFTSGYSDFFSFENWKIVDSSHMNTNRKCEVFRLGSRWFSAGGRFLEVVGVLFEGVVVIGEGVVVGDGANVVVDEGVVIIGEGEKILAVKFVLFFITCEEL